MSLVILIGYLTYNESRESREVDNNPDLPIEAEMYASHFPQASSIPLPDSMDFAGEMVPLDKSDVWERLDREIHINTYWHNNTIFLMKRANRWFPEIEQILMEEGVPADFKYIPAIEGQFLNAISPKAAVGFWQIRKPTGLELGLEISREVDERYDPIKSTRAACKYFKKAYEKFGNWTLAAASYDRGRAGIQRALDHQGVDSYYDLLLNDETSRYVFRILAIKEIIENPELYGFNIKDEHLYEPYIVEYVEVDETIPDLVTFARNHGITYKDLKKLNPWLRKDQLTVKRGKQYLIAIPGP
jgi:hypothetical protein